MKPIRGERKRVVIHDWEGNETAVAQEDTAHVVTDDGALQSFYTTRSGAFSCGCVNIPVRGFCAACCREGLPGTVCIEHFGLCLLCSKPLCPRHSLFPEGQQRNEHRYCRACYEGVKRKHRLKQITRLLLAPFVEFEERHGK